MTTQNLTIDEVIKAITVAMQRLEWGSGRAALKTLAQELERSQLEAGRQRTFVPEMPADELIGAWK